MHKPRGVPTSLPSEIVRADLCPERSGLRPIAVTRHRNTLGRRQHNVMYARFGMNRPLSRSARPGMYQSSEAAQSQEALGHEAEEQEPCSSLRKALSSFRRASFPPSCTGKMRGGQIFSDRVWPQRPPQERGGGSAETGERRDWKLNGCCANRADIEHAQGMRVCCSSVVACRFSSAVRDGSHFCASHFLACVAKQNGHCSAQRTCRLLQDLSWQRFAGHPASHVAQSGCAW